MTQVELKNGYYIEIKKLSYTLRQRYTGKSKTGEPKESIRTHGYFNKMELAIMRYIELMQMDVLDGERLSLEEYVKTIDQVNKIALQGLENVLERFEVK